MTSTPPCDRAGRTWASEMEGTKRLILGDEYDEELWATLGAVLKGLGGVVGQEWHGTGGSQEIDHFVVAVGDQEVVVEAETFVGITVSGPPDLVDELQRLVAERGT